MIKYLAASLALAVSASTVAENKQTVLNNVQMPVMVNQGGAYVDAQENMFLYPGDQLMVLKGGSAQVHYATGCIQELSTNEIARISAEDSCSPAAAGTYNQVGGPTTTGGGSTGGGPTVVEWVGIAAIAGTGGYIVYEATDSNGSSNNNRPPASP